MLIYSMVRFLFFVAVCWGSVLRSLFVDWCVVCFLFSDGIVCGVWMGVCVVIGLV